MSIESARAYVRKMETDEDFRRAVLAFKNPKARMEFVKSGGYDFSPNEIKKIHEEMDEEGSGRFIGGSGYSCYGGGHECGGWDCAGRECCNIDEATG